MVRARNLELTQTAEELVSEDRRERIAMPTWELAARLIARGQFTHDVPPDDLHYVLHEHSLLQYQQGAGYTLSSESKFRAGDFHANRTVDDARSGSARTRSQARSNQYPTTSLFDYPRAPSEFDELPDDGLGFGDDIGFGDDEQDLFIDSPPDGFASHLLGGLLGDDAGKELDWMSMPLDDRPFDFSDDGCQFYQEYLENFYTADGEGAPLSHPDYHLLEAELEMLVGLEAEFGYLMPEQAQRQQALADRLFLDPNSLFSDDSGASGFSDYSDEDESPFWEN